jgi:inorganic phosphate transporter, PiT family
MLTVFIVLVGLLLAFANGANDNFKGVATLLGSGTTEYRGALIFATVTTGLGSITALVVARALLAAFSGKGLVPPEVVANPAFPAAVGIAAAGTVLLATRLGFPVSTTHALIGGLVGAGLVASPGGIDVAQLGSGFAVPLLLSPVIAIALAAMLHPPLRWLRRRLGVTRNTCVCVGTQEIAVVPGAPGAAQVLQRVALPVLEVGEVASCHVRYEGAVLGVSARKLLDRAHYASAGAVSFARGLNDTPKIAALLLVGGAVHPAAALLGVGIFIGLGGVLAARRVAETLSHGVTEMNPGQGFTANIVTALLVIGASRFGVPVSTTHVSVGSLFGIGAVTKQAHWGTIGGILLAWVITLPIAAGLGALGFVLLG